MTAKHQTPEYRLNARIRRAQVKQAHRLGEPVACWRGGRPIHPGQPFDIGHLPGATGSSLSELAPEHRSRTVGCCDGNRAHGGRVGAAITNRTTTRTKATTWPI